MPCTIVFPHACLLVCTHAGQYAHHPHFSVSTQMKIQISLLPAFLKDSTSIISPIVSLLDRHFETFLSFIVYFTCQALYSLLLMLYWIREPNVLMWNFFFFFLIFFFSLKISCFFQAAISPVQCTTANCWVSTTQEVGMSKSFQQVSGICLGVHNHQNHWEHSHSEKTPRLMI